MNLKFYVLVSLFLLNVISCKNPTEPPDPPKPPVTPPDYRKLSLSLVNTGYTDAWLKLISDSVKLPFEGVLKIDTVTRNYTIDSVESFIYVDQLQAQKNYTFQFSIAKDTIRSNSIQAKTSDTTSSNFTWQTFLFGEYSNSILWDVAIINDNNIWAVGEIYLNDSTGQPEYTPYNAIHWNGIKWKPLRVTVNFRGNLITPIIQGIHVFSETDIWFTSSLPIHGDGVNWIQYDVRTTVDPNLICNKIWGLNSQNLYTVGRNGSIAHFDGENWTKIESGTGVNLVDLWGSPDGTVWACGYKNDYSTTVLLKITGTTVTKLYEGSPNDKNNNEYINLLSGGWTNNNEFTYVINYQYMFKQDNKPNLDIKRISENYSDACFSVSALNLNDMLLAGQNGFAAHYNGYRLNIFSNLGNSVDRYRGSSFKGNTAVMVGVRYLSGINNKGIITVGKR